MSDRSRQHASWQQYYGYSQQPQQLHYTATAIVSDGHCPPPLGYSEQQQQQQRPPNSKPNAVFRCDTCDLSLDSSLALEAHLKSHITCSHECCDYTACPKLVKAHHQAVHGKFAGSGFKTVTIAVPGCRVQRFRICVGNSPQDIAQWIAERRKKFPRKAAPPAPAPKETRQQQQQQQQTLGSLLEGYGSSSSDDDNGPKKDGVAAPKKEDAVDAPESNDGELAKKDHSSDNRPTRRVCRFFARTGNCRNGDACSFGHEATAKPPVSKKNFNLKKRKDVSSATLLRKLLRTDADREMALTLQLLRYIANCNYLQGQKGGSCVEDQSHVKRN